MRSMKKGRLERRITAVLAGMMTLAAGWRGPTHAAPAQASAPAASSSGPIVVDAETARVLVDLGLLELAETDRSGAAVGLLQGGGTGVSVLVVLSAEEASISSLPLDDGPAEWFRTGPMPAWRRDFPNGSCKDGVLTVRWYREHTVTKQCPDGSKISTIIVEEVIRTYACTDAVPALPPGYSEPDAWPRHMPVAVPGTEGGSKKRFKTTAPTCSSS